MSKVWTPERAKVLESRLIAFLKEIPDVTNPQGCSYDRYGDFKVIFGYESSAEKPHSHFLEFQPERGILRASPGGLSYSLPVVVKDHISRRFPNAHYFFESGPKAPGFDTFKNYLGSVDGFHNWSVINESELPE